jgi:hypothetical protein
LRFCCKKGFGGVFYERMITVAAISEVAPDQLLTIELPKSVTPGQHRVVVVIEENHLDAASRKTTGPLRLTKLNLPTWPEASTYRREDIYGDTGR